ncbi:MAG: hypothetical protein ACFE9Q_16475 [Candidatus Hodarchaeota archaeon]
MTVESDIIILGHLAKDIIEIDGNSISSLGGAVYYGGIAGSHMGLKITVITRLKEEDFSLLTIFKKYGVNYYAYPSEETSGLKNIYSSKNVEFRSYESLGFAGIFKKEEIPNINTKFFVIGPIVAGEIDLDLLNYVYEKYSEKLCLDIQGFIRVREQSKVIYQDLSKTNKELILTKVNVLKLDQKEAEILTQQKNIYKAAKEIAEFGPREILITHEKGISVFTLNDLFFFPWKNKRSEGRTGRGDTAFISYLGSRLTKNPEQSLKFAAALTSLKLEQPGPFMLPLFQVEELIKKEYGF